MWPSVFDTGQGIGLPAEERARLALAGLQAPPYIRPQAGLWQDKAGLLRYLLEHWQAPRAASLIAITWLSVQGFTEATAYGPHLAETGGAVEATLPGGRELLGFDVGDGGLLSGLSNCGYQAEERAALRLRWAPQLNEHHLFEETAPAFEFRALADERVPEHAPFFVYGLYLVGPA